MKIPMTSNRSLEPEFELEMRKAARQVAEVYGDLRNDPAFAGTMVPASALCGGCIGAFIENEMTDDEIATFIMDVIAKVRPAMASMPAPSQTGRAN